MNSKFFRNTLSLAGLALCLAALPACSDDGDLMPLPTGGSTNPTTPGNTNPANTNPGNTTPGNTDNTNQWQCDPVGQDAALKEQNELINAPLATGAVTVNKTAKHPGNPGPVGLP